MNQATPAEMSPPRKLPVVLMMAPMAWVPTKPPRFPKQLIKAIPAAAEYPVKNSLGSAQKGPNRLKPPDATKHQSATARKTEPGASSPSSTNAVAATMSGTAAWYRRSSFRSELRPTKIITGSPIRYGIITSNPTVVFEYWLDRLLTNCGIQKII